MTGMEAAIEILHQNGRYIAVMDGWWMASGKTKRAAIDSVIKRYQREIDGLYNYGRSITEEPVQATLW